MLRARGWLVLVGALTVAAAAAAQEVTPAPPEPPAEEGTITDVIVVTASRTEQPLSEVPAAVTVLTAQDIAEIPADDYGDLLRNVPGLNVSQVSARDIQITGRSSTNTLATSQLVLLDGRSLYLDFFGFVMWDFLPVNPSEIKQIEVVRGPGSAVWGANAMTGVINLITKRPSEMVGTSVILGAGELGTKFGSLTHAGVAGNMGYKLSGGYFEQDPYPRPTGAVPDSNPPTVYPPFANEGTKQPKVDTRFDWDIANTSTLSLGAGYAGTDGIVHSGIGPFAIESGARLAYAKADWNRQALHVGVFGNFLDADSTNLLTRGASGRPLEFGFKTETINLDLSNTSFLSERNILTYGANARTSDFELSIAEQGTSKDEYGVFLQDEILFGDKVRWLVGARWDDIDPIGSVVSPRTSLNVSPNDRNTFRVSFNRAFRSPSVINNYLDVQIVTAVGPFLVPARANGNVVLEEERLDAYEVGWTGRPTDRLSASLAVYRNKTTDSIDFFVVDAYRPGNLPTPSATLPPFVIPCFATAAPVCFNIPGVGPFPGLAGRVPSGFSYRNVGETIDQGVEFALNGRPSVQWSWFLNYSFQDDPEVKGIPDAEVNKPPQSRVNLGLAWDNGRFFVNSNANYADEAYWSDVLNVRAPTDAYTMVNASVGARLAGERITVSVIGSNIFDEDVQQHIFGDLITRKITGQVAFKF